MMEPTQGAAASAAWLDLQGLDAARTPHWYVEITIPSTSASDSRFELNIYPEEWGFVFRRGPRISSVRVTDVPFVHGRDDHKLVDEVPPLAEIHRLLDSLEARHGMELLRTKTTVKSNLVRASAIVRAWLVSHR
jgi:hypothetical protein